MTSIATHTESNFEAFDVAIGVHLFAVDPELNRGRIQNVPPDASNAQLKSAVRAVEYYVPASGLASVPILDPEGSP